jgi:hypothetical protein
MTDPASSRHPGQAQREPSAGSPDPLARGDELTPEAPAIRHFLAVTPAKRGASRLYIFSAPYPRHHRAAT